MDGKHLIVAVHGVGEQKVGATVDDVVTGAVAFHKSRDTRPAVEITGEAFSLPENRLTGHGSADDAKDRQAEIDKDRDTLLAPTEGPPITTARNDYFPVNVRRVRPVGDTDPNNETVFAEVFWADRSPAPVGAFAVVLDLLRTILGLGYVALQNVEDTSHVWAQNIVRLFTIVFYMFVAGVNAFLLIGVILLIPEGSLYSISAEYSGTFVGPRVISGVQCLIAMGVGFYFLRHGMRT